MKQEKPTLPSEYQEIAKSMGIDTDYNIYDVSSVDIMSAAFFEVLRLAKTESFISPETIEDIMSCIEGELDEASITTVVVDDVVNMKKQIAKKMSKVDSSSVGR